MLAQLISARAQRALTLAVDDGEEEHRVILLVRRVVAALERVDLRTLDADVRRVDDADAVEEEVIAARVGDPLILLLEGPRRDGVGCEDMQRGTEGERERW